MTRHLTTAICLAAALALPACKIVKNKPAEEASPSADASGDDARIAGILAESWEPKLKPLVAEKAIGFADLSTQIAANIDEAGKNHGQRGSGEGAAWNFAVADSGTITAANLTSRARVIEVDHTGDGVGDVTLQLGPVVKGSALRDFAPFFVFTDFRDQIEFAKLSRALNDAASAAITLPEGDLVGKTVGYKGVFAIKKAGEKWLLTPTEIMVSP